MKGRRWRDQEDARLKEAVLEAIRNGRTQLAAFADIGREIGRTAGACGFRWNAVLRQQDPTSYREAKRKRVYNKLQEKRAISVDSPLQAIAGLQQLDEHGHDLRAEVEKLKIKLRNSQDHQQRLLSEQHEIKQSRRTFSDFRDEIKEKYQNLLHLFTHLDRQRSPHPREKQTLVDTD